MMKKKIFGLIMFLVAMLVLSSAQVFAADNTKPGTSISLGETAGVPAQISYSYTIYAQLYNYDAESAVTGCEIDWGDGFGWQSVSKGTQGAYYNVAHTYNSAGIKTVNYRCTSAGGTSDAVSDTITITIKSAAPVAVMGVTIDEVKVEGATLKPGAVNKLNVERGQKIDVQVTITSSEDVDDVQIETFIAGYEHGTISDTAYFDASADTSYVKHFSLTLPDRVEKDDYVLRVLVTARATADEVINDYKLKISSQRHAITIKDVIFRPESEVEAGRAVIAVVRIKNMGDKDEDGIKITASIPELKVSDSDYIDELKEGETTSSEELWLKIADPCVKTGSYDVKVTASYQDGDEETSGIYQLGIVKSDACEAVAPVAEEVVIIGLSDAQGLTQGGAGVIYPVTITNAGAAARTFTLEVVGADWADYKVSPGQVVAVGAGETQTVSVYVAAKGSAAPGMQMFAVSVKDSAGKVVDELTMRANIEAAAKPVFELGGLRRALEVGLVVLIVLLVIVGLIVAFTRLRGGPEEEAGQTYY